MISAPELQKLYFKLEAAESYARSELKLFDLARDMDRILKKIHLQYVAARGWSQNDPET